MNTNEKLIDFIEKSPCAYHVTQNLADMFTAGGFVEICEAERAPLLPGCGYFIRRGGSSIIAFRMPKETLHGFMICASHGDSPSFKVKGDAEMDSPLYVRINTEPYGGSIGGAWLDRPLSVAGRIVVKNGTRVEERSVNVDKNSLIIPNIAPHLVRLEKYNPACELVPLLGLSSAKGKFYDMIAAAGGVTADDIIASDLFLYNRERGYVWGEDAEFVSAPRLDDLQCTFASASAFIGAEATAHTVPVCAVFDNEEVGSTTKQGAASTFLSDVLHRIVLSLGGGEAEYMAAIARSMMVSADNAHAVHPSHPEYADATHKVALNGGIVIKHNANQKYTTDAVSGALFETICKSAGVPLQHYFNRSDLPGGSTLGNIANTKVSLCTVDIGLAQLAMHSPFETAGARDTDFLLSALSVFFCAELCPSLGGIYELLM